MKTQSVTRHLKIYYAHHRRSYKKHPVIRLAGDYLIQGNFHIGDRIEVTIEKHRIIIEKPKAKPD